MKSGWGKLSHATRQVDSFFWLGQQPEGMGRHPKQLWQAALSVA